MRGSCGTGRLRDSKDASPADAVEAFLGYRGDRRQ
jgi:hypothetical protein